MKGTVQRRWKVTEPGDPPGCKHGGRKDCHWVDDEKDAERCSACGAKRVRSSAWTWQHQAARNGKRVFVTGTATTRKAAQAALVESLSKHARGEEIEPNKATVGSYLREWLELVKPGLRAGTERSYHDIVEHRLVPHIGDVRLAELRPVHIARCYDELRKSGRRDGRGGLSETSLEHTHRCLHAALEHAVRSRSVARNVADDVVKPKRGHHEMQTWSAEELRAFLASTSGDRLHALYVLAATTGTRRGELLGLKWADIDLLGLKWSDDDLKKARLSVRRARVAVGYQVLEHGPKTPGSVRTIDLDAPTLAALKHWRVAQKGERLAWGPGWVDSGGYVFTRENGEPLHPHQVADAFDAAVRRSGLPTRRFHDLRHGWATMALGAGVPVKVISERLGHSNVAFTLAVYAHATPGMQAEAAEKVAGLVFGS